MTPPLDYKRLAAAAGHAQRLAGHLHGATAYRICERSSADMLINDAIKELRDCAAAMGFDLVERVTPQQAHDELLNALGSVGSADEAPILSAMSKGEYLARQTKTIPVSDLLHDEPGVQVDGSTTMGFR